MAKHTAVYSSAGLDYSITMLGSEQEIFMHCMRLGMKYDGELVAEIKFNDRERAGGWKKHPEIEACPCKPDDTVEIETYASSGNVVELAKNIDWRYVKFYRIAPAKK